MTKENLREQFENEKQLNWINDDGEPELEYVEWLENKLIEWNGWSAR